MSYEIVLANDSNGPYLRRFDLNDDTGEIVGFETFDADGNPYIPIGGMVAPTAPVYEPFVPPEIDRTVYLCPSCGAPHEWGECSYCGVTSYLRGEPPVQPKPQEIVTKNARGDIGISYIVEPDFRDQRRKELVRRGCEIRDEFEATADEVRHGSNRKSEAALERAIVLSAEFEQINDELASLDIPQPPTRNHLIPTMR